MKNPAPFQASCPAIAPEETVNGLFGRLARFNGDTRGEKLRNTYFPAGGDICEGAARIGLDPQVLIDEHSLLPFSQAHIASHDRITIENSRLPKRVVLLSSQKGNKRSALCGDCVDQDFSDRSFAYWHREHQIRGVLVCHRHQRRLDVVDVTQSNALPGDFKESLPKAQYVEESSICLRFARTAYQLLQIGPELVRSTIAQNLRAEAGRQNVTFVPDGKHTKFCWESHFSEVWDAEEIRSIVNDLHSAIRRGATGFENTLQQRNISMSLFVFAASCLADNEDKALRLLTDDPGYAVKSEAVPIQPRRLKWAYENWRGNIADIARGLDEPYLKVQRALESKGLPSFDRDAPIEEFLALRAFIEGSDVAPACHEHGVPPEKLLNHLRQSLSPFSNSIARLTRHVEE